MGQDLGRKQETRRTSEPSYCYDVREFGPRTNGGVSEGLLDNGVEINRSYAILTNLENQTVVLANAPPFARGDKERFGIRRPSCLSTNNPLSQVDWEPFPIRRHTQTQIVSFRFG